MKRQILLYFVSLFIMSELFSQSCDVSLESLKGQYTGNCRKGKAEGTGTAIGIDSYTGNFKNGYPDGEGKYTWKNGSWYEGLWKNGLFEGHGTWNNVENNPGSPAVLTGFWKKGKYISRYEKPFIIHSKTNNINDINIRKLNGTESEITITVKNITGGALTLSRTPLPKSTLVDIQIIEGRFEQQVTDESSSPVTNKYILRKVTFPFHAILSFETTGTKLQGDKLEIEIFEDGYWYVQVGIDN